MRANIGKLVEPSIEDHQKYLQDRNLLVKRLGKFSIYNSRTERYLIFIKNFLKEFHNCPVYTQMMLL